MLENHVIITFGILGQFSGQSVVLLTEFFNNWFAWLGAARNIKHFVNFPKWVYRSTIQPDD